MPEWSYIRSRVPPLQPPEPGRYLAALETYPGNCAVVVAEYGWRGGGRGKKKRLVWLYSPTPYAWAPLPEPPALDPNGENA